MIQPISFSEEHIRELQKTSKRDPVLLERAVYAFGLLEALARVGMPFIFKGGTCLMLLMNRPRRLMPLSKRHPRYSLSRVRKNKNASEKIISKSAISSLPMIPR